MQAKLSMLGIRVDEAEELFTVLDADQSGEAHAQLVSESALLEHSMWCRMGLS